MLSNIKNSTRLLHHARELNTLRAVIPIVNQCCSFQTSSLDSSRRKRNRFVHAKKPLMILPQVYVPPPVSTPILVREDSVLKSIVLTDKTYPIKFSRLDEIGTSHTGWVSRMVPPPQFSFEVKRNHIKRFDFSIHFRKGKKPLTILKGFEGDIDQVYNAVKWRLGKNTHVLLGNEKGTIIIIGYHVRQMNTFFQALGF